jgi:hypothetical protein
MMVVGIALLVLGAVFWTRAQIRKPRPPVPVRRHRPF